MKLYLIRKGHLGDVIMTEPVARAFKARGHETVLVTECCYVGDYLAAYDHVEPYSAYASLLPDLDPNQYIVLAYEVHPELHYVDGFAKSANVPLGDRMPRLRGGSAPPIPGAYCVIAPHTSSWSRGMREWSYAGYCEVGRYIESECDLTTVQLTPEHSFEQMLALIEHCSLFIGNDSGPGIIAQAYGRPAVIVFGATDHSKVLFSPAARPVLVDVGCNGCRQWSRNSLVDCNSPVCLKAITSELVMQVVAQVWPSDGKSRDDDA